MKLRRQTLVDLEKRTMPPKPPKIIATVPVFLKTEKGEEVIGDARVEQTSGDNFIYHINASGMTGEHLRRGFSFGKFTVPEETDGTEVQLEK